MSRDMGWDGVPRGEWGDRDGMGCWWWNGVPGMGCGGGSGVGYRGWGTMECLGWDGVPGVSWSARGTWGARGAGQAGLRVSGTHGRGLSGCAALRGAGIPTGDPAGAGYGGSGEQLLTGPAVLGGAGRGLPAEPARMGLMPARAAGRASPCPFPLRSPARRFSVSFFPFPLLILLFLGAGGAAMCSRPPQVPPAAPPCSLPGSRCLRMPRSLVVVPLGCSAAPVPDTSPGSSWARGRGRSLLSAPAWLVTIFCPPPSRCVPPPALGQQQWGPHWNHFLPTPFMPLIKGWGLQQRVLPFRDGLQGFFAPDSAACLPHQI